jgi:hypothetical protein
VAVAAYRSVIEAHLARALLESEGLDAVLAGEHAAHLLGVQSAELLVPADEAERAREILRAAPARGVSEDFVTADLEAPRCARCGSLRLEPELRLLPLPGRGPRVRCGSCGARDALGAD